MNEERILILGACGQIGVELTKALRHKFGAAHVFATDLGDEHPLLKGTGPFAKLDATDGPAILDFVRTNGISQIYLLAALLSATGEKAPMKAWDINMRSLLQILEMGVQEEGLKKIFWPSSIAVFGPTTPRQDTPQATIVEPATVYGISKWAGELWCQYYHDRWGLDVRSIRYPGLISPGTPGGGTTDYAVAIYHEALAQGRYTSFLSADTCLPMMYMDDAIRATLELMDAPAEALSTRLAYNIAGMSFTPEEIGRSIGAQIPRFTLDYAPDFRQKIADSWPQSIDDTRAREDWGWQPEFDLKRTTAEMLSQLARNYEL